MDCTKKEVLTDADDISVSAEHVGAKQVCAGETSMSSNIYNEIAEEVLTKSSNISVNAEHVAEKQVCAAETSMSSNISKESEEEVEKEVLTKSNNISVNAEHVAANLICATEMSSISLDVSKEILEEAEKIPVKVEELKVEPVIVSELEVESENVDKLNSGSENISGLSLDSNNDELQLSSENVDKLNLVSENVDELNIASENVDESNLASGNVDSKVGSEHVGEDHEEKAVSLTMMRFLPECFHSENIAAGNNEKSSVVVDTKVTLKRKSESLALISSYQVGSDSEGDLDRDAFSKPQLQSETDSDSSTDSESNVLPVFNSDSDVASESEDEITSGETKKKLSKHQIKAPGELGIDDLPPINELQISVKEEECLPFGKVHSIVETLVVIESLPDVPALNLDSVLFTKIGHPLGEIFDVFGPVKKPYYTIRFNSQNDIKSKSLSVGTVVYCAPKTKYTQYVFIHQLAKMKGSDASWRGDLEPPPGYMDYSDDEEERTAKKQQKEARLKYVSKKIIDLDEPPKKCPSFEERMNHQNTIRNQLFSKHPANSAKRSAWVNSSSGSFAPGAGRPMPEEGTSKGRVVRSSNFSAPAFQRQAPSAPPTFPFRAAGSGFHTPPPPLGVHGFSMRNNQQQPNSFVNQSPGNMFLPQNHMNGNRPTSQIYQPNSSGFQQASPAYHHNGQEFSSQNFASLNPQPFPRNNPPFPPLVGGYQPNNHPWPSNNQTFGGQPSFPSSHPFQNGCPPFKTNNAPGFSQSCPNKQQSFDNQGLLANARQPFSQNNPFCPTGVGSFQPNRFLPDSNPFPQQFQQNCPQFQGQSFQTGYSLPNNYPYPGSSPSFPQGPPPFIPNNQLFPSNLPNYPQSNNPTFSQSCGPFPPK